MREEPKSFTRSSDTKSQHTHDVLDVKGSNTYKTEFERKREFDKRVRRLNNEFGQISLNQENVITVDDLQMFLKSQTGVVSTSTVNEIFAELDRDGNGQITKYILYIYILYIVYIYIQNIYRNEYIKTCLQMEDLIKQELNEHIQNFKDYKSEHEELRLKLLDAQVYIYIYI